MGSFRALAPAHAADAFGAADAQAVRRLFVRKALRYVVAGLLWASSLWLLADSLTFALAAGDEAAGIARGCYTAVERGVGCKVPSLWIRPAEFGLGALLFISVPAGIVVSATRASRRKRGDSRAA